jgi:hypothetical protein
MLVLQVSNWCFDWSCNMFSCHPFWLQALRREPTFGGLSPSAVGGSRAPAVALNRLDIENCLVQLVSQSSLVERSAENRVLWTAPWTVPWTVPYSLLDLQSLGAPHYVAMSLTRQAKNVFEDRLES